MEKRELVPVSGEEQEYVGRALLFWLNLYPKLPRYIDHIAAEYLGEDNGMSMFAETAAYKTQEYISGAYNAQYQFSIVYRTSTSDSEERLDAAEVLSNLASWAEKQKKLLNLGSGKRVISVERISPAVMIGRGENLIEDYQILMVMNYEVRNQNE